MTIDTRNYVASHGRRPRPSQYGMWQFTIVRRDGAATTVGMTATYKDAGIQARAEARMIGGVEAIHVNP